MHLEKNRYSMIERLLFLADLNYKIILFKLFLRQYEILRHIRKIYVKLQP